MIQKQTLQAVQQVASDYERELKAQTDRMISTLKGICRTYGEIDTTLKRIRQDITWEGRWQRLPLLDAVEAAIEKEKGCLLVAGSQSSMPVQ